MAAATRSEWPWERLAASNASSHEVLVTALAPVPGERWLDVGTGSGGVALRAARAGADVVGVDIAEEAVAAAHAAAADEGLDVRFTVGDAAALPYADASFHVVVSAFGAIFASSRERAAAELARVCRPGGRLGLTLMPPDSRAAELWSLARRYGADDGDHPASWAEPGEPERLLGGRFELEVSEHESPRGPEPDADEAWRLLSQSLGPLKALAESLDPKRLAALRDEFLALRERYVGQPARYVLVRGVRR